VLAGLTLLVNPYGIGLFTTLRGLLGSPIVQQYMIEHQHLDWHNPYQLTVPLFGLVYLLALANLRSWRTFQVTWALPAVWLLLSIDRVRHCPLFAITTAIVLIEILPHTRVAAWLLEQDSWLYHPSKDETGGTTRPAWTAVLLTGLAGAFSMALLWAGVSVPLVGSGWYKLDPTFWPVGMRPRLQEFERDHPGAAVFNDMAYGGFLIYYTPGLRPFIDDRCELYGNAILADYFHSQDDLAKVIEDKRGADELIRRDCIERWEREYGVAFRLALVRKDSALDYLLAARPDVWTKLDAMDARHGAVLYERQPLPNSPKPPPPESR
jgi:hypothetical protein